MGFSALPPAPAWPTLHPGFAQPLSPPRSSPKAPPTLPSVRRLEAPPTRPGPRLLLPISRPRLVSFTFVFTRESPGDLRTAAGRQPGRGSWRRNHTEEDAVPLPAAARRRLAPTGSQPQRCVCQALPGVSPVSWRLLGIGKGRTGLASAAASVATNTHATSHTRSQSVSRNGERGVLESLGKGAF